MVRRLGFETNLYSFDGAQQKLAWKQITCGLPTGNHRARQFSQSRKYASEASSLPLIHFISYQALIISQKDAFGLESRKSNSVVPVLF